MDSNDLERERGITILSEKHNPSIIRIQKLILWIRLATLISAAR